jgi:hypothetical protein
MVEGRGFEVARYGFSLLSQHGLAVLSLLVHHFPLLGLEFELHLLDAIFVFTFALLQFGFRCQAPLLQPVEATFHLFVDLLLLLHFLQVLVLHALARLVELVAHDLGFLVALLQFTLVDHVCTLELHLRFFALLTTLLQLPIRPLQHIQSRHEGPVLPNALVELQGSCSLGAFKIVFHADHFELHSLDLLRLLALKLLAQVLDLVSEGFRLCLFHAVRSVRITFLPHELLVFLRHLASKLTYPSFSQRVILLQLLVFGNYALELMIQLLKNLFILPYNEVQLLHVHMLHLLLRRLSCHRCARIHFYFNASEGNLSVGLCTHIHWLNVMESFLGRLRRMSSLR